MRTKGVKKILLLTYFTDAIVDKILITAVIYSIELRNVVLRPIYRMKKRHIKEIYVASVLGTEYEVIICVSFMLV
jgi:hypothetical protein